MTIIFDKHRLSLQNVFRLKAITKNSNFNHCIYLEYRSEAWARKFFEHWQVSLRWQRLKPFEEFAELIERHWDGIAAFCLPENKVSLGFVEGLNTKIRVLQRRAYGLRDEEYLRLKILTCMLPDF
jgi:transposase